MRAISKAYKINREITASRVGVIGDQGQQLGVMTLAQALQAAQELGLDLVEVSPTTVPPVCRILDYGKFRYLQDKKLKEARKNQKLSTVREVRFKTRIGEHDMASKTRQVRKFLEDGDKVKVSVMFRGREIVHQDIGVGLLKKVADEVKDEARLEKPPTLEGRFMSIILVPASSGKSGKPPKEEEVASHAKT